MHFYSTFRLTIYALILSSQDFRLATAYPLDVCGLCKDLAQTPFAASVTEARLRWCLQTDERGPNSGAAAVFAPRESSFQIPFSTQNAFQGTNQQPSTKPKGYVAFGDSYAAGMGTGNTNWTDCRRGEFSYPRIIASILGNNTDFQNLPCSGATMQNVLSGSENSQIDAWANASHTDFGTLTIGGNDIGFYNILTACVVRVGGILAGSCDEEIASAYEILHGSDFSNNLEDIFRQIVKKSGRPDFRLFVMGYPRFFNAKQRDCDHVTFGVWDPHHNWGPQHDFSSAWLYQDLRTKLNNLTTSLNHEIFRSVSRINFELVSGLSPPIRFIDPNTAYEHHRFCEIDGREEVKEPDSERRDTWFFLNGWDDIPLEHNATAVVQAEGKIVQQFLDSTTALPDPNTCKEEVAAAGIHDWAELALCDISIAYSNASSEAHRALHQHVKKVSQGGNVATLEIAWYIPTRLAKMFHPRSRGHQAMAQLIQDAR